MGILSGVVSYIFGLVLNLLDACIDGFLGALGFDLDSFESYFPAAGDYHDVIIGFAIGLLFIMLIFQIFRNFGVILDMEVEDPLKMLGKTALFLGMIIYSRSIMNFIIGLLVDPYAIFLGTASAPYEFKLMTLVTSAFGSVFANPFMTIVALIMFLVLGWQFLKLTIECVERYVVFYFVLYCAPVVFATGAFKSTAQILKSWSRMLASQAILLLLNIWSIRLFSSFMPVFEQDAGNIVFNFLLGYAFLKFAQKADTLLRILGLNTASTGDMMRSVGGTVSSIAFAIKSAGSMASSVGATAGRIFGGGAAAGAGASGEKAGNGGNGFGSSEVSGMSGAGAGGSDGGSFGGETNGDNRTGGNDSVNGVTASGISTAKHSYASDVLGSAKSQMPGAFGSAGGGTSGKHQSGSGSAQGGIPTGMGDNDAQGSDELGSSNGTASSTDGNIDMKPDKQNSDQNANPANIDMETKEGLDNLAHGLHHDKYDPVSKTFSGGGFPEFTGENANVIASSQLPSADGVGQSTINMPDGTTGTVYQNSETGDAHVVQFGSVDNGVMQGSISQIDPETGKTGEDFAFKAVHSSVPNAETFSANSVSVSDGFGGSYHMSTGANTDIFASSEVPTAQSSGSSYAPGGGSKMGRSDGASSHSDGSSAFSGADIGAHGISSANKIDDSGAPTSSYSPGTVDGGIRFSSPHVHDNDSYD